MNKECIFCGTILDEEDESKYICNKCNKKVKLLNQINKADKAQEKIRKSVKKYLYKDYDYQKERDSVISKIINQKFVFNSSDEMCFAMQLEKERISYIPNYKIGNYKVDFFLPDMKRIIEIDGELYHTNEDKEFLRERAIMRSVGEEYEIVRIPASYVPGYIIKDLKEIINFVVDNRNLKGKFRDTRWDKIFLEDYFRLQRHLRRYRR